MFAVVLLLSERPLIVDCANMVSRLFTCKLARGRACERQRRADADTSGQLDQCSHERRAQPIKVEKLTQHEKAVKLAYPMRLAGHRFHSTVT